MNLVPGLVTKYDKSGKNKDLQYIDFGLLVLKKKSLTMIEANKFIDLGDILKILIEKKELTYFIENERFYEIGSMSGKKDFTEFIKST